MATQYFKRNLSLNLYREGKKYCLFVSSCRLREIKMSDTFRLCPQFGDPWPSCLLPSQLEEIQAGIKIAGRNINNLRYADDTIFMAESKEELKSLLKKVKAESEKVGLKLNIQKT